MIDAIRGYLRMRRFRRLLSRPFVRTPYGFYFFGSKHMESGDFEKTEVEFLRNLFSRADRFVNVGANFGYYVCLAQVAGLPTTAIEPSPDNLEFLKRNLQRNDFEKTVTTLPFACGEVEGKAELFGVGTGASLVEGWARNPRSLSHQVLVRRLDKIIPPETITGRTVFLVDVEGFELEVMKGATGILENSEKPIWIIESGLTDYHRKDNALNENFLFLVRHMSDFGYSCYALADFSTPISVDAIEKDLREGQDSLGSINFVFSPEGAAILAH